MTRIAFLSIAVALILGFAGASLAQVDAQPTVDPKTQTTEKSSKKDRALERAKKRAETRAERRKARAAEKRAERRAGRKGRLAECRQRAKSSNLRGFDRRAFLRQCRRRG